jgi:hypothetical protein
MRTPTLVEIGGLHRECSLTRTCTRRMRRSCRQPDLPSCIVDGAPLLWTLRVLLAIFFRDLPYCFASSLCFTLSGSMSLLERCCSLVGIAARAMR